MDHNHSFSRIIYNLKKALVYPVLMIMFIILLSVVLTYSTEFPASVKKYYSDKQTVYWEIRQISISPIFDEPETSLVEFYFQQPHRIFIVTLDKHIYYRSDTLWSYLINHKQIQRSIGEHFFNPFDFIDSTQTYYQVVADEGGTMTLINIDESMEPDSLQVRYNESGKIIGVAYQDVNDNRVIFEFLKESFLKTIPDDNFLNNIPEGVEIIDLSD
jgi:outer membrane lipoprotein-sorting protein